MWINMVNYDFVHFKLYFALGLRLNLSQNLTLSLLLPAQSQRDSFMHYLAKFN